VRENDWLTESVTSSCQSRRLHLAFKAPQNRLIVHPYNRVRMVQRLRLYLGSFWPDGPHSFPIYFNRRRQVMMAIVSELYAAEPGWLGKSDRDKHFNNWLQTEEGKPFAQGIVTVPGSKHTLRHIAMPLIAAVALLTRGLKPSIIRNDGIRQLQSVLKKRVLSVGIMGLLHSGTFRVCDDDCTLLEIAE
jgi:hypothetical protein